MSVYEKVWCPDNGDGTYTNPVLCADYSDPDAIRVGKDFYMIASSFNCVPAVPVLHSVDMVNWEIVGHIAQRLPFDRYDQVQHGSGIWAPSLRYHDGLFYAFLPMPDEGIFVSTARDPAGEWSPLHCIKEGVGLIDPCPLWDDDGSAYMVHAYAKSRCGIHSKLAVCKIAPDCSKTLEDDIIVFEGLENGQQWVEGPKFHKRDGFYYIFAPAGGVPAGWQLVLRSRSVYGPYEHKMVLAQNGTPINGPHQGAWVELEQGDCFIHFQDRDAYGRVVHLQPMHWEDGWPVIGVNQDADGVGQPVLTGQKPVAGGELRVPQTSDDFAGHKLGLQWQWPANPGADWYSLTDNTGVLRLYAVAPAAEGMRMWDRPNILLQKFPAERFRCTTKLCYHAETGTARAGLAVTGDAYAYVAIEKAEDAYRLTLYAGAYDAAADTPAATAALDGPEICLRVYVEEGGMYRFAYSVDGVSFQLLGGQYRAKPEHWIGSKIGLFAWADGSSEQRTYADFDYFTVEK